MQFLEDVRAGLTSTPKRLACRYFYDDEGSALFDDICRLPEYYLWRAEHEILEEHAFELAARCAYPVTVFELGSGSASKTRLILKAMLGAGPVRFAPIDISEAALEHSAAELAPLGSGLNFTPIHAEYEEGLRRIEATTGAKVVLWLGSNVGNLDRDEAAAFLSRIAGSMSREDRFFLGVDLRKDREVLEAAYDDAQGVTALFNKNILARINQELGGEFDLTAFAHRARYDVVGGKIDMYLVSRRPQRVRIRAADLDVAFDEGEAIHTESSYKYSEEEIAELAVRAGMTCEKIWMDAQKRFADVVLRRADGRTEGGA